MPPVDEFPAARVEAFSDAVIAIAITLLILEIKVPRESEAAELVRALARLWPSYLAFLTSFCTIGMMWLNHHRLFALIKRTDETLVMINMALLLAVTWVPFPTALLAQHLRASGQAVAAIVYSGTFLFISIVFNVLWWYAMRSGRVPHVSAGPHPITRQYAAGPPLYAVMLMIGIRDATACLVLSLLIAIYFSLPPRLWAKKAPGGKPARVNP